MGRVLQSRLIRDSVARANKVCLYEETFTIDDFPVRIQNINVAKYIQIARELESVESEVDGAFELMLSQLSHSIVELGDTDLHGVDFIEEEVPAGAFLIQVTCPNSSAAEAVQKLLHEHKIKSSVLPPEDGQIRKVKVEVSDWIRRNILEPWGPPALRVAYEALTYVMHVSEQQARAQINFPTADANREEKARKHLIDAFTEMDGLPQELVTKILADVGMARIATTQEKKQALDALAEEAPEEVAAPEPLKTAPELLDEVEAIVAETPPPPPPPAPKPDVAAMMRARQPMNRQVTSTSKEAVVTNLPTTNASKVPVPDHIKAAAKANMATLSRSQKQADLEGEFGNPEVILERVSSRDIDSAKRTLDQPPTGGINPRFQPPRR